MTVKTNCPYCDNTNLFNIPTIQESIDIAKDVLKDNPNEEWALDMLEDLEKVTDKSSLNDYYALNTPIFCNCKKHYFYNYKDDVYDYVRDEFSLHSIAEKLNAPHIVDTRPSYIYFLRNKQTGLTKIGYSQNIKNRQQSLKTAGCYTEIICKFKTIVEKQRYYENVFHCIFQDKKKFGEWFDISPEMLEKIAHRENLVSALVNEGKQYNEIKDFIFSMKVA